MERLAQRPGDIKISKNTFPALEALIVRCDRLTRITTTKVHVLRSALKMACARVAKALRRSGVSFLRDSGKASQRWWHRRKKQETAKWIRQAQDVPGRGKGVEEEPTPVRSAQAAEHVDKGMQMRMEKRSQVCGWSPADPAYPIKSHQGGTRVGTGGRLPLPPALPGPPAQCLGGQRLERGSEQSKSQHLRPVTHSWPVRRTRKLLWEAAGK